MRILILVFLLLWPAAAPAAVEIRFHSDDFGENFPHAFIVLEGTLDETGEQVSANYGFTLRHLIGPSVMFGSVEGTVGNADPAYIAGSNRHFSITLSDAEYHGVMALVERWRALPQPSYSLSRRNCVTFVAEMATLLGLRADPSGLMRRPRAFLDRVREQNLTVIAARGSTLAVYDGGQ